MYIYIYNTSLDIYLHMLGECSTFGKNWDE